MDQPKITFDDGAAYETFMGVWSRHAGHVFLDWLAPPAGLRWADVGCGNGAFSELLFERCAPSELQGVDPSEQQLAFARGRLAAGTPAAFTVGDAQQLPWPDASFDAAVMALVIFFLADPPKGVAEMARVVKPGGIVSSYSWDIVGGGFPFAVLQEEMAAMGTAMLWPPSVEAARMDVLLGLWAGAGLLDLQTREITVERSFDDFEAFWHIAQTGPRLAPTLASMPSEGSAQLKARVRARLGTDRTGRVTCRARANAIAGRVPS